MGVLLLVWFSSLCAGDTFYLSASVTQENGECSEKKPCATLGHVLQVLFSVPLAVRPFSPSLCCKITKNVPGVVDIFCSGTFSRPEGHNIAVSRSFTLTALPIGCAFAGAPNGASSQLLSASGSFALSVTLSGLTVSDFGKGSTAQGAVAVAGGAALTLVNCTFLRNSASALSVQQSSVLEANGCVFQNNVFLRGKMGQLQRGGALFVSSGIASCSGCTFQDNEAADAGGAVLCGGGHCTFTHCLFQRNRGGNGAALANIQGALTELTYCGFENNGGAHAYGIAYCDSGQLRMHLGHFSDNVASKGGAIMALTSSKVTVTDATIQFNQADQGGAVFCQYSVSMEFDFVNFVSNYADVAGGAIYCGGSSVQLSSCDFENNTDISSQDNTVFCAPFPQHSPCQVVADSPDVTVCVDAPDPQSAWLDPVTLTVLVCSAVFLAGTVLLVVCVVRSIRRRRRGAMQMEHMGFHDDLSDATAASEDFSFSHAGS